MLSRRNACLVLAGAALPSAVLAQEPPPGPQVTPPTLPPQIQAPMPATPAPRPVVLPGQIDKSKIYYVFFDQAIDVASMRSLRRQLASLVEAGVAQITLVLSSPGGLLEPTLTTYSFIRALPAIIDTHAQGFVQSAATVLFLAGQGRSSDRAARFLFHPSQSALAGTLSQQQIEERLSQFGSVDAVISQIYKDRTTLTDDEIARFGHGQVIYTADQARDFGVVQTIADLKIPGPQTARILLLE